MYGFLKKTIADHYDVATLQKCYRNANGLESSSLKPDERFISFLMKVAAMTPLLRVWRRRYLSDVFGGVGQHATQVAGVRKYDEHLLNLMINRVYDLPEVVVDENAPARFNVLVPAFSMQGISAGFFGVFQVARYLKSLGSKARLILFDNFDYREEEFKRALLQFPGMENLFDELEIEYIGERKSPLVVSPRDTAVATVWYSAYLAEAIQNATGGRRPFLYLIQDYETRFFPGNSLYALAERTYSMNYCALISSQTLKEEMIERKVGRFKSGVPAIYFNNACSSALASKSSFIDMKKSGKRRLVIYSRPDVNRNMFELAALTVIGAYKKGYLPREKWEFYGIGIGAVEVVLDEQDSVSLKQMERMTLAEYMQTVPSFDLCVSLMASPHPSMLPYDLAGSGAVVVTNTFGPKTQSFFSQHSDNIIATEPHLPSLIDAVASAVARVEDLDARYDSADFKYPRSWEEVWSQEHAAFIRANFAHTLS
jgi:hypothetical protein